MYQANCTINVDVKQKKYVKMYLQMMLDDYDDMNPGAPDITIHVRDKDIVKIKD